MTGSWSSHATEPAGATGGPDRHTPGKDAGVALFGRFAYRPTPFPAPLPSDRNPERLLSSHPARHGLHAAARALHVAEPFDPRAVEAYWLGVRPRRRADGDAALDAERSGAEQPWEQPTHALDVFGIGPWVRMLHNGDDGYPLVALDRCRVRWGTVVEVTGSVALVASRPVVLVDGHLGLGAESVEVATLPTPAAGDDDRVTPGAHVALHWDWICIPLDDTQLSALKRDTFVKLNLANRLLQRRGEVCSTSV